MELSARDKRILAEIECGSALEDPGWVRRFERLTALRRARRRLVRAAAGTVVLLAWTTAAVLGATIAPRPLLWAALGLGLLGLAQAALWHRRGRGPLRRRRIPRIPRQGERPIGDGGTSDS